MPTTAHWQLETPVSAVIFDCDGTLSSIEGIDELARENNAGERVAALTEQAMGSTGINPKLYRQRLDLTQPRKEQVIQLGKTYFDYQAPDALAVIQIFNRLDKAIYLISAGLNPAVTLFGEQLTIPRNHIFAVDIQFDTKGHYLDFDTHSPLTHHNGKRQIVSRLISQHQTTAYIGDGMNDYVVHDLVTRFVGYGGTFFRENIAQKCDFYVLSMSALLPLLLTQRECEQLTPGERTLLNKGLEVIQIKE